MRIHDNTVLSQGGILLVCVLSSLSIDIDPAPETTRTNIPLSNRQVLLEMQQLVLALKIRVKEQGGRQAEERQRQCAKLTEEPCRNGKA